jgi:hypothetical protein
MRTVISREPRSEEGQELNLAPNELANLSLRTLVIAQLVVNVSEALAWLIVHRSSMVATTDRVARIVAAAGARRAFVLFFRSVGAYNCWRSVA